MDKFLNFVVVVQAVLYISIASLLCYGVWGGVKYVSKHGLKSVVEQVWQGEQE